MKPCVPSLMICAALFVVGGCGSSARPQAERDDAEDRARVTVSVQAVARRTITSTITALGRCDTIPDKLAMLTPLIEGQVTTLLVSRGALVRAGQPIVELDKKLATADLAEKEASRDSLVAALRLLQSTPRVEEQQANKLAIEQSQIATAQAAAVVERLRPLRGRGEVSEQQMFDAERTLKHTQVQQQIAEAQYEVLMLRPRDEAIAEAQSKIAMAEEAVKTAQARLAYFTIISPIEGILESLTCRPGETVAVGATVGEVVDRRNVLIKAWLPVVPSRLTRVGAVARVSATGPNSTAPSGEQQPALDGKVVFVGAVADAQTGNVPIEIAVANSDNVLVIGQVVHVDIDVTESKPTLAVPETAVHDEGDGAAITVVREGKAVVLHPTLGPRAAGWIAVSEADTDLKEGESVVIEGAYNLPTGALVAVVTSSEPAAPTEQP